VVKLAAELKQVAVKADVTKPDDIARMVDEPYKRWGRLDVLFNNAGVIRVEPMFDVTEAEWDRVMDGNLKSVLWACKHAIPHMRRSGGGSIITVSSIAGVIGLRDPRFGMVSYSTAKAGVMGLTRSLAAEYASVGIRANCIIVGMVDTPMLGILSAASREQRRLAVPLQTTGTGWDVGWAAVYLASDESRWVTGIEIPVDAGQMRLFTRPG